MTATLHDSTLLKRDQTLLVVVDMQEPFLRNIWQRERIVRNVSALVQGMSGLGVAIVSTTQYAEKMGGIVPEIRSVLPAVAPIIDKMAFSCFGSPEFADVVKRSARSQILLCGVETHICVQQTACDSIAAGYQTYVALDSVSSRSELNWRLGAERLRQEGVLVSSVESALYEALKQAGTPEFKQTLKLIR